MMDETDPFRKAERRAKDPATHVGFGSGIEVARPQKATKGFLAAGILGHGKRPGNVGPLREETTLPKEAAPAPDQTGR